MLTWELLLQEETVEGTLRVRIKSWDKGHVKMLEERTLEKKRRWEENWATVEKFQEEGINQLPHPAQNEC